MNDTGMSVIRMMQAAKRCIARSPLFILATAIRSYETVTVRATLPRSPPGTKLQRLPAWTFSKPSIRVSPAAGFSTGRSIRNRAGRSSCAPRARHRAAICSHGRSMRSPATRSPNSSGKVADYIEGRDPRHDDAEYPIYPKTMWEPYKARREEHGVQLYGALGIDRGDAAARLGQYKRNFEFFNAPVALVHRHRARARPRPMGRSRRLY